MAYNQNIPQATDALSQSQQDILNNFLANYNAFNVNHVTFNAGADMGKHKWLTLPQQGSTPPIVFGATEMALYSAQSPYNAAVNEIFINKTNQATVVQIPSTASILSAASDPGNNVNGWTYLPSGILLKWGNATVTGISFVPFPTSAAIPVFTNVMSVQLTTYANSAADTNTFIRLSSFTNLGFNAYGSSRTTVTNAATSLQYLAIGY